MQQAARGCCNRQQADAAPSAVVHDESYAMPPDSPDTGDTDHSSNTVEKEAATACFDGRLVASWQTDEPKRLKQRQGHLDISTASIRTRIQICWKLYEHSG